MSKSIDNLKYFLKEMFQFNENDLDFGIYKIYNLKRSHIESFIDGDKPNDLAPTIEETLKEVNLANQKTDAIDLYNFLKTLNQDNLLNDPEANYKQLELFISTEQDAGKKVKLTETLNNLSKSEGITDELKDKIYNHILGFFQMYYSNGDFGYNDRSRDLYKVPYEADYNGSDTMFHWKHKGSLYIKTGTSFNAIKFELNGKKIEYRLETNENSEEEGTSQNNNKDSQLKHYRFDRIEKVKDKATNEEIYQVIFNLSDVSTSKVAIYKAIYKEVFNVADIDKYLEYENIKKDGSIEIKGVFNDLTKDFDKVSNGQIKGLSALREKKKTVGDKAKKNFITGQTKSGNNKYQKLFDEETKDFTDETLKALYTLDQKLNSFYIGNDADYFIHENLNEFLTNEKNRYVKNYIFDDLESIYAGKLDNTTLLIAKAFDKVSTRIIEFLSAIEDFQKHLFTKKKKVVESEYCITVDYIDEKYYPEILANKTQLQVWENLFSLEVKTIEDIKANPTLVVDTKCFKQPDGTNPFKDKILAEIEDLEDKTNGLLINSENYQALELLQTKFKEKVKTIYIDPPYNTGDDGFAYKDNFKHSSWSSLMENRLNLSLSYLSKDGKIFSSIDDREYVRLKELFDIIYSHNKTICIKMSESSGVKMASVIKQGTIPKFKEYLITATNDKLNGYFFEQIPKGEWDNEYNKFMDNFDEELREFIKLNNEDCSEEVLKKVNVLLKKCSLIGMREAFEKYNDKNLEFDVWREKNAWRIFRTAASSSVFNRAKECFISQDVFAITSVRDKMLYLIDGNFNKDSKAPRVQLLFADDNLTLHPGDFWSDISTTGLEFEGGIEFKNGKKPLKLINRIVDSENDNNNYVLDFFAGSGTTGHSVIDLNKSKGLTKKYLLFEMGLYFDRITKPRIQKVIFSDKWNDSKPMNNDGSPKHIFKYQVLEQYEDVLDNLKVIEYKGVYPENLPLQYLYKPEENQLDATLDLFKPFSNSYKCGQPSAIKHIDLTETYNYLQGYFIKSIKTYELNKKYYKVVETTNGILDIWRDIEINEDDSNQVIEIASKYTNIHTIEVNAEFATLNLDKSNHIKVEDTDIELKIISKEVFNQ